MRMKRFARVFTSAMLAGAMMMTMGGMTAFAEDANIPLTKEVVTPTDTYVPTATYTFKLAVGDAGTLAPDSFDSTGFDGNTGYDVAVPLLAGLAGGVVFDDGSENGTLETTIGFTSMSETDPYTTYGNGWKYSKNSENQIKVVESVFEKVEPGIYHYTINEVSDTNPVKGMTYDSRLKDIYVYIVNDGEGNKIGNVIVANPDGTKDGNNPVIPDPNDPTHGTNISTGVTFTNTFDGKNEEGNDTFYDLTVKKIVTGNQGERDTNFKFSLSVTGSNRDYYLTYGANNKTTNTVGVIENSKNGAVSGIDLKDGDSFTIHNLLGSDIYSVEELQDTLEGKGYTVKVATVAATDNQTTDDLLALDYTALSKQTTSGHKVENMTNDTGKAQMVVIENNRDVTTPTGIVLSFAPYIMLVALAGVFAVLFLRKKKEEF